MDSELSILMEFSDVASSRGMEAIGPDQIKAQPIRFVIGDSI